MDGCFRYRAGGFIAATAESRWFPVIFHAVIDMTALLRLLLLDGRKLMRRLMPIAALALGGCSPVGINAWDVQKGLEAFYSQKLPGSSFNRQFVARCAQVSDFRAEITESSGEQIVAVRFAGLLENGKSIVWRLRFRREGQVWSLSYKGGANKLPCETVAVGLVTDATYASSVVRDLK
jgi:hypothetical protein